MKKIFGLIAALILISGCDDGDMTFKTFDFSNSPVEYCTTNNNNPDTSTEIYFKRTGTEGLILQLPKGTLKSSPTKDPVTNIDKPYTIVLGTTNKLTYQNYVSAPTSLCTIADIPKVTETWTSEGTLLVSTVATYKDDKLTGYIHTVTMQNVSFKNGDQTITIVDSPFGDITKANGFTFNFIPDGGTEPIVKTCNPGTSPLYTLKGSETLILNLSNFSTLFQNTSGTQQIPFDEDSEDISVLFNVYQGSANTSNVCGQGSEVPSQPMQRWFVEQGTLVIETSETGGIYTHKVYLKDASFANNQQGTFNLNDIVTVTENGYFFGAYQE